VEAGVLEEFSLGKEIEEESKDEFRMNLVNVT
jgi:hypothetical protein